MTPPSNTDGSPVSVSDRPIRIFIAPTTTLSATNDTTASTTGRQARLLRLAVPALDGLVELGERPLHEDVDRDEEEQSRQDGRDQPGLGAEQVGEPQAALRLRRRLPRRPQRGGGVDGCVARCFVPRCLDGRTEPDRPAG